MKGNSNFISKCILTAYAVVLRCYPRAYREQFGELMLQAVKDELRYSRQQTTNQIAFTLIKDVGLSLPREHYAFESQQGFARKSFLLLLVLLTGLFLAREPLQQITTASIEAFVNIPNSIQRMHEEKYSENLHTAAQEMLHSQDPNSVVAGATILVDMDWLHKMTSADRDSIHVELERALISGANDPAVLFNAMRICGNEPDICNVQRLLSKTRTLYPQNAMTWLRHAAVAKQQGNTTQQLAYLEQALTATSYRNYGEINHLKQIEQIQNKAFVMPWYFNFFGKTSQFSSENLAMLLTIHSNINTMPSCESDLQVKTSEVLITCQKIALKLLENQSLDFGQRYVALALTKQSGDTRWLALAEQDDEMYKQLYSLPSEPKLPSLQDMHDALAQGKVDAMLKRIIIENQ
ncbi:MAG: hypothetical protein ABI644_09580 [Arenimonas sp.]